MNYRQGMLLEVAEQHGENELIALLYEYEQRVSMNEVTYRLDQIKREGEISSEVLDKIMRIYITGDIATHYFVSIYLIKHWMDRYIFPIWI